MFVRRRRSLKLLLWFLFQQPRLFSTVIVPTLLSQRQKTSRENALRLVKGHLEDEGG
jgi:hypothetical protein